MRAPALSRGEIWVAEMDKQRPVIVLTRDPMAALLSRVLVVPVTTTLRGIHTEVEVSEEVGLAVDSVASLDNTQLLERRLFKRKLGQASPATMQRICKALHIAVGCD